MSGRPLSRAQQARARAAARKAAEARALRHKRARVRCGQGPLRDRVIGAATTKRYRQHVKEFFKWCKQAGLTTPRTTEEFDQVLSEWAGCLWAEGDARSILANGLSGLSHFVPSLRRKLNGAWRLHAAWVRSEPAHQAPPMTLSMVQAMAGWFVERGYHSAAVGILLAFNVILRTGELCDLRTTDFTAGVKCVLLILRDTKIGARLGVHQEASCKDPWLVAKLKGQLKLLPRGALLIGMSAKNFRSLWRQALKALGIPKKFTPYCLRRGGATSLFRHTGSYDKVAEKGRWLSLRAMRNYINQALEDAVGADELESWAALHADYAKCLHSLPN